MITGLPYPGLRPFEQHEADIFFGREEQTDELLRKLGTTRFLAVIGPSGCGKSSLARAGMMAALEAGFLARAGPQWRMAVMRPGSRPADNLTAALLGKCALGPERCGAPEAAAFLAATLRRGPLGLVEVLRETPLPPQTNLLVVVDQFEEIFRFRQEDRAFEADAFVALLLESAAQREVRIYIVITMRSDYIGDCTVFSGLPEALNTSQYLTPRLTREQMRAAIERPARVFEGDVEPALVNKLLNEAGRNPDELPVLQHLLMRMWTYQRKLQGPCVPGTPAQALAAGQESEPAGRVLTLVDYQAVGGFELALSKHANEAYEKGLAEAGLGEKGQRIAEVMFRSLCVGGAGKLDSRRPTSVSTLTTLAQAVIGDVDDNEVMAVANVFRTPQYGFLLPPCPERLDRNRVLDITHESLIRRWDLLNKWVKKEADSVATYRSLEQAAQREKERKAGLWRSPELDVALAWKKQEKPVKEWAARCGGDFELALHFLDKSEKQRTKEIADVERSKKARQRLFAAAFVVVLIFAILAAGFWWQAKRVARGTFSRELAAAAFANLPVDPERSVWLALHAVATSPTEEAQEALQRSVQASRARLTLKDRKGEGIVWGVAYSRDGKLIASGGRDGITRIWDAFNGELRHSWPDHVKNSIGRKDITGVAFSPKADILATVGADGALHLRDLISGEHRDLGQVHKYGASAVTFSGDGRLLATAGWDGSAKLWDVQTGHLIRTLSGHKNGTRSVSFSPDNKLLATGGSDRAVRIWEVATGKEYREFPGRSLEFASMIMALQKIVMKPFPLAPYHEDAVNSVAFSPNGLFLATASDDRTTKLWDLRKEKGQVLLNLSGHANNITGVVFSPDGARLATSSGDMTAKIWDAVSGRELMTLAGHSSSVQGLAFSPDQQSLVTASDDGTAKVWDASPGHTDQVYSLAFSPNGKMLASVGNDWTLRLWELTSVGPKPVKIFPGHYSTIHSVDFSADGKLLVTGGRDRRAIVWDEESGKKVHDIDFADEVTAAAFSPKADVFAAGSLDKTVAIIDAHSGAKTCTFPKFADPIQSVAFSRDGKWLATAAGPQVYLWDALKCQERPLQTRPKHDGAVLKVAFSPDGTHLATAGWDHTARVWNATSGREVLLPPLFHDSVVADVTFSHDGKWLATASWDRTARVWDASNGKLLHTFYHLACVNAVQFSPNDQYLGTASDDYSVYIFPLNLGELRELARKRLTHSPALEYCKKYLRKDTCPPTP